MYRTGQIKEKIDEERLKMFLEQMGGSKKKEKIIVKFLHLLFWKIQLKSYIKLSLHNFCYYI